MDLLRFWMVFRSYARWILVVTLVVMVGTFLYVRRLPKIYVAAARIVIPQRGASPGGSLLSGAGRGDGIAGLVAGSLGLQSTATLDLFTTYLESRTMAEQVVAHFDIQRRFNIREAQSAASFVMGMREFLPRKTGSIDIRVESPDPVFAADMANFYADNLDQMNRAYNITDASRYRRFVEGRLAETHVELREAEERVRQFGVRNKILVGATAEDGPKRSLDTYTNLQNKLLEEEARLASMRAYVTNENPDLVQQQRRTEEIERQLREAQYGSRGNPQGRKGGSAMRDPSFSLPVAELPSTSLEGIRLQRDLKLQDTMFMLLSSMLEQAKIAEARDLPTLQILDRAIPPLGPSKPKVRQSVLFAGLLAFVVSFLGACAWDAMRDTKARAVPSDSAAG